MKQQQQQTTKALIEDAKSFLDTSVVYIGHIRPCDIILQLQTNYYPSPNTQAYIHSLRHSHSVYAIGLLNIKVLMASFQDLWLSVGWWELMLGLNQWGFLDCLAGPASLISTCETELHWGQRESHHLTPIRTLTAIKKIVSTLWHWPCHGPLQMAQGLGALPFLPIHYSSSLQREKWSLNYVSSARREANQLPRQKDIFALSPA